MSELIQQSINKLKAQMIISNFESLGLEYRFMSRDDKRTYTQAKRVLGLHKGIKKAIDTYKVIEELKFIDLTDDEAREIDNLDNLANCLRHQAI